MSISTTFTPPASPQVADVQQRIEKRHRTDWLVIAHPDSAMLDRLCEAIGADESMLLPIAQRDWNLDRSELRETVQWSAEFGNAKRILLVGHSQGGPQEQAWTNDKPTHPTRDGASRYGGRLMDGVIRVQQRLQQAKDHFVEQLNQLCEIVEVQDQIAKGQLDLVALFYIAETGAFLKFDLASQSFEPLDNGSSAA